MWWCYLTDLSTLINAPHFLSWNFSILLYILGYTIFRNFIYLIQQHMISILPLCDICGQCWLPGCSKSKQSFYSHLVFTLPAPSSSPNLGLVLPPRVSPVCPVWPPVAPAAVADGRGVAECGRAALQSSPVLPGRQHVLFLFIFCCRSEATSQSSQSV